jgi:cell fate regulator YaaT (PSP1 superfamily)
MNETVGVQFRECGRIHYFDSGHFVLGKGDKVVVETDQGLAVGVVCTDPRSRAERLPSRPLRKIFRLATKRDSDRFERNHKLEREVYDFCCEKIEERSLPMCLVYVECLFDNSKIIVYFTADGRVDFRELVKDLVKRFHSRIEMRQIGVRHKARMVGGLGTCGQQLCCASFLNDFEPVSIRMAKEQNLSLNPTKISGLCGRLMCCLTYEYAYYEKAKKDIPKIGKKVATTFGEGKVIRQNVLKKTLTVSLESGEEKDISYEDVVKESS